MRILIAEAPDQPAEAVAPRLLDHGFEIHITATLKAALDRARHDGGFDLLLLDLLLPGLGGLVGLPGVLALRPAPRIVLAAAQPPRAIVQQALAMGVSGVLPKDLPARSQANALRFMGQRGT